MELRSRSCSGAQLCSHGFIQRNVQIVVVVVAIVIELNGIPKADRESKDNTAQQLNTTILSQCSVLSIHGIQFKNLIVDYNVVLQMNVKEAHIAAAAVAMAVAVTVVAVAAIATSSAAAAAAAAVYFFFFFLFTKINLLT